MFRFLMVALLAMAASLPARGDGIEIRVSKAAEAAPTLALGVAYSTGSAAPTVLVFGPRSTTNDLEVGDASPWHIGSITKSFTSALILRLVEADALSLDKPIGQFLSNDSLDMHADWQEITLRQLLSHTSRLPANAPRSTLTKQTTENLHATRREVLQTVWDKPLAGPKGAYSYSNLGYVLAGFIAEEVTGKTWEELIRTEIAETLDLQSLGFGAPDDSGAAWGHRSDSGDKQPVPPDSEWADNPPWFGPAGRLHLSLLDLVRWGQAQLSACKGSLPQFLSAISCEIAHTAVANGYGLGWVVVPENESQPAHSWHNGSNTLWYARLIVVPEQDFVLAAATNSFDAERIDLLTRDLMSELAPSRP